MSDIDALKICKEISASAPCQAAKDFYHDPRRLRDAILLQGAANFDETVTTRPEEKPSYRALYYIGADGYMNMHIKQNRIAFEKYLKTVGHDDRKIMLVDFGCGPMTAGLALAENLSRKNKDYKNNVFYYGVDVSKNMCDAGRWINRTYKLFAPSHFHIEQEEMFYPHEPVARFADASFKPDIGIVCFSFALASSTLTIERELQQKFITALARNWHDFSVRRQQCEETYIIHHNPKVPRFHENWRLFKKAIKKYESGKIRYSGGNLEDCYWRRGMPSQMARIKGVRIDK